MRSTVFCIVLSLALAAFAQNETTTQPLTSSEITSQPMTSTPLTTQDITSQPLSSQPLTSQPLTSQPLTSQPLTSQPLTSQPIMTSSPVTSFAVTSQPLSTGAVTTSYLTTQSLIVGQPSIRFVNDVEGSNLTVFTNTLNQLNLPYGASTNYYTIASGSLTVTNVLNGDVSLSNGEPILLTFGTFTTMALVQINGTFTLVKLQESLPNGTSFDDQTKAYVRIVDLGSKINFVTLAAVTGNVASYVGFLEATPFQKVSPTVTEFRIYNSQTQTYNTPSVILPASLQAGKVYTVFFFTPGNGASAALAYDHDIAGAIVLTSTSGQVATSTNTATTTGNPTINEPVTTELPTTSSPSTSASSSTTSNVNDENPASQLKLAVCTLFFAAFFLL